MTTILWLTGLLLASFIFGILTGILSLYSQSNSLCNLFLWVSSTFCLLTIFAFSFIIIACLLVYVFHAVGSPLGIILFMLSYGLSTLWLQLVSTLGANSFRVYILKIHS